MLSLFVDYSFVRPLCSFRLQVLVLKQWDCCYNALLVSAWVVESCLARGWIWWTSSQTESLPTEVKPWMAQLWANSVTVPVSLHFPHWINMQEKKKHPVPWLINGLINSIAEVWLCTADRWTWEYGKNEVEIKNNRVVLTQACITVNSLTRWFLPTELQLWKFAQAIKTWLNIEEAAINKFIWTTDNHRELPLNSAVHCSSTLFWFRGRRLYYLTYSLCSHVIFGNNRLL